MINQGTINSDGGGTISLQGTWINTGNLKATNGTLALGGTWDNSNGTITVQGAASTLSLGGTFTIAQLGNLVRSGGAVNMVASTVLDGQGSSIDLAPGSNTPWTVDGTIKNATISCSSTNQLTVTGPTFDHVQLNCDVLQNPQTVGATDVIKNGLVLNNSKMTISGSLRFLGTGPAQTISGTGEIVFNNSPVRHHQITRSSRPTPRSRSAAESPSTAAQVHST